MQQVALLVVITVASLFIFSPRIKKILKGQIQKQKLRTICQSEPDENKGTIQVTSIHVHPIKSLRPVSVQSTKLTHLGLPGDRALMLVRPSPSTKQYRFVTQRQCSALATINVSLPTLVTTSQGTSTMIEISNSDKTRKVFVDVSPETLNTNPVRYTAGLWDDTVQVVDVGDKAAEFLQSIMKSPQDDDDYSDVRLVAQLENDERRVDSRYCPAAAVDFMGRVPRVSLTDGFPILIASEESLEELNRRLKEKGKDDLPMSRFRPNIVCKGLQKAFEEDEWKAIQIGENGPIFHVVKGCPRCKQSCTDQVTGERFDEPLETLKEFRALGKDKEDVYFAQNVVLQSSGEGKEICVGDTIRVLTSGDPVWDEDTVQAE